VSGLTECDDVQRSAEADTDETQLHGVVVTVPNQQLGVGSNGLHRPVVDVTSSLECSHVLTLHAAGTVDVAQPVGPAGISTIDQVSDTTSLVDLHTTCNKHNKMSTFSVCFH